MQRIYDVTVILPITALRTHIELNLYKIVDFDYTKAIA